MVGSCDVGVGVDGHGDGDGLRLLIEREIRGIVL